MRRGIQKAAIRKALEDWSDRLSKWDRFWTAIVVGGLVIEYIPSVAGLLPTATFTYIRARTEVFTDLGGFLVIAGVLGELVVGARSGRVETDLREENESIISTTFERAAKSEQLAAEAIERAETERAARTTMLSQLKPRTFTRPQMEEFVAQVKGAVLSIDLFTLTEDPEAAMYGAAVLEALRRANIEVTWHRSERFHHEIIGKTGIELYEYPTRVIGDVLWEAFLKAGQALVFIAPTQPLDGVPSPSLFVARQVPAFLEYPEYSLPHPSRDASE